MAGITASAAGSKGSEYEIAGSLRPDGSFDAAVGAVKGAHVDWLARVSETTRRLRESFGSRDDATPVSTIIATIADPIDSGLGYQFETSLQALRRGFEQRIDEQVFYRDRSWLPWDDRELSAEAREESENCRLSTPGIMLFRGSEVRRPSLFALLLVGESPTSGLRQAAMLNALNLSKALEGPVHDERRTKQREVRIVGPMFSGSARSLALSLRNWASTQTEQLEFYVTSGTATGSDVPRILGGQGSRLTPSSRIRFVATTVPEATVECSYFWLLTRQLGVEPEPRPENSSGPERLQGVATLSESGTEFGATSGEEAGGARRGCRWAAGSAFRFPFHVSTLRDAYEALDHRGGEARKEAAAIARATSLDASLREARLPIDSESTLSEKTKTAEDITLRNLLDHISNSEVRHVAIHATDVGDAIFLARKIRDVAPDVRLAFFEADALLLHPEYRKDLLGSLVVSPYPFLGASGFSPRSDDSLLSKAEHGTMKQLVGFESGNAQGVYNALLAQRGAPLEQLRNYTFGSATPLPIWTSIIGRGRLVPNRVIPARDCDLTIHGTSQPNPAAGGCLPASEKPAQNAGSENPWETFTRDNAPKFGLDPDFSLPRSWDFLLVILTFAFWLDRVKQKKVARRLAANPMPESFPGDDQQQLLDCAIGRTKWRLYAAIRSFLFVLVFAYMGCICVMSVWARGLRWTPKDFAFLIPVALAGVMVSISARSTYRSSRRFFSDYRGFAKCVRSLPAARHDTSGSGRAPEGSEPPVSPVPLSVRAFRAVGVNPSAGALGIAKMSFAQLRVLSIATVALSLGFSVLLVMSTVQSAGVFASHRISDLAIMVLRNTPLANGVSPSAPVLLCIAGVYVWAAGRMARLALAHATSRVSPPDGEADLVSTPIRLILFPKYEPQDGAAQNVAPRAGAVPHGALEHSDEGFTRIEGDVLDAIWRPITGPYYWTAALTIAVFPLVMFAFIKPLSAVESAWTTRLLGLGLWLAVFLIGVTLVQLVRYWLALEHLLKRTMEHALGPAFRYVPSFARDSVDHQVSRSPNELLRWAGCARQFAELIDGAKAAKVTAPAAVLSKLGEHADELRNKRVLALKDESLAGKRIAEERPFSRDDSAPDGENGLAETELATRVITAASDVARLLDGRWDETAVDTDAAEAEEVLAKPVERSGRVTLPAGVAFEAETAVMSGSYAGVHRTDAWSTTFSPSALPASGGPPSGAQRSIPVRVRTRAGSLSRTGGSVGDSPQLSRARRRWRRAAQTFVATVVTLLIHRHIRQFRHFVHVLTLSTLLLLLAVTSYPFEPYRLMLTFIWVVMGAVVASSLWIFIQMDRNTLMSHISGTTPDRVTFDGALALRFLAWAVVPLLGVAAAEYPEVANLLVGILSPFVPALR